MEGLKVVEIGNTLAGAFCGTRMADFGASVVKIEPPGVGDMIRGMGKVKDLWFAVEARNKKNVSLNLKHPRGRELLEKLLKDADILIENFRPGVFARLGFPWERLQAINPRLIYVCSSGFGRRRPSPVWTGLRSSPEVRPASALPPRNCSWRKARSSRYAT